MTQVTQVIPDLLGIQDNSAIRDSLDLLVSQARKVIRDSQDLLVLQDLQDQSGMPDLEVIWVMRVL